LNERSSGSTVRWLIQALLGIVLVLLLAIHLIVNHWVAPQGLLTYADIIRYYDVTGIAWMEALFLIVVTVHCLLGMHSILLDLNVRPRLTGFFTTALAIAGGIAITYGIWLIRTIVLLSVA
jgi:succinate dehydrogenase hydrophobic anchor subunit